MTDERARGYHRIQLGLSLLALALGVAYLSILLATGAGARLAAWITEWTARPWLALAAMALVVGAGWRLLTLPLTWLAAFWLPRRFGLLHQSFARWVWDAVKAGAIGGALALAGIELVYALLRWTPWWWLAAAVAFLLAAILLTLVAPVWLVPLFYRLEPLADGELRERLLRLGRRTGVPVLGVWVGDQSRKSRTANAAVTGLGRTRRIILFDTLVREFTADEIEAVLAHELAHHAHADIWRGLAVQGAVTLATFWLADRLLAAGAASLGLAGPADLAGLPLLLLIAAGCRRGGAATHQWMVSPRGAPGRRLRGARAGIGRRLRRGHGATGAAQPGRARSAPPQGVPVVLPPGHQASGGAGPGAHRGVARLTL